MMETAGIATSLHDCRVLVTGATGFVGRHLTQCLASQEGASVRASVRDASKLYLLRGIPVELVFTGLDDEHGLLAATEGCDVVIHCAATSGTREACWEVNVRGTERLLQAAIKGGVSRFIYLSSVAVYGPHISTGEIDESCEPSAWGYPYADSKLEGERLVGAAYRDHGLGTVVLRPTLVYGPGSVVWTIRFIEQILAGRLVLLEGGCGICNHLYVGNLIQAIVLAATVPQAVGEDFIISDGLLTSWKDFLNYYARMCGKSLERSLNHVTAYVLGTVSYYHQLLTKIPSPFDIGTIKDQDNRIFFRIDKARQLLGFTPQVSLTQGMLETELWLREKGYLPMGHKSCYVTVGC